MQFNRQTDYALRALIFLAVKNDLSTIDDIAQQFCIAREHLTKIISQLAKLGYIVTSRGKGGGLKLNPKTLTISLLEIIKYIEPTFQVIDCDKLECPISQNCRLKRILNKATKAFLEILSQYTLKDILPKSSNERVNLSAMLGIKIEPL
jgi:Rrf2 family transcriptional regulator, nitric oxide-sensitive transcriptional repressor